MRRQVTVDKNLGKSLVGKRQQSGWKQELKATIRMDGSKSADLWKQCEAGQSAAAIRMAGCGRWVVIPY